jgi:hypothetical protein
MAEGLNDEPTIGEVVAAAKAVAPASLRIAGYLVTYHGEVEYTTEKGPSGPREE